MELLKQLYLSESDEFDDPHPPSPNVPTLSQLERRAAVLLVSLRRAEKAFERAEEALTKGIDFNKHETSQFTQHVEGLYINGTFARDFYLDPTTPAVKRYNKTRSREVWFLTKLEHTQQTIKTIKKALSTKAKI